MLYFDLDMAQVEFLFGSWTRFPLLHSMPGQKDIVVLCIYLSDSGGRSLFCLLIDSMIYTHPVTRPLQLHFMLASIIVVTKNKKYRIYHDIKDRQVIGKSLNSIQFNLFKNRWQKSQGSCMSHYKNKTSATQRIYNFRKEHIYKSTVSITHIYLELHSYQYTREHISYEPYIRDNLQYFMKFPRENDDIAVLHFIGKLFQTCSRSVVVIEIQVLNGKRQSCHCFDR